MADTRARITLDSSVWVNYLTDGGAPHEPIERLSHSRRVIEHGQRGDYRIVVPALVLAEIAGAGSVRGNHLPRATRRKRVGRVRD